MLKKLVIVGAALVCSLLSSPGQASEPIEFKVSHFVSPMHGWSADLYKGWERELNKRLGEGSVKIEIFAAGSSYGNVARQYDQVAAGVVDVSLGLRSIPGGRFPRMSIFELPYMFDSAGEAAAVMWQLFPEFLSKDFPDVKVLALHSHPGGAIHTRGRGISQMEDLKGLRIRGPGAAINDYLNLLGAETVGLPPSEIYENLQRGVIDGVTATWSLLETNKLYEVTDNHFDCSCYAATFFIAMNKSRYESLPPEVQKAIDDVSNEFLVPQIGVMWDKWDSGGRELVESMNRPITKLSPDELKRWKAAAQPLIDDWIANLAKSGVDDAQDIYTESKRLSAEYKTKHGEK